MIHPDDKYMMEAVKFIQHGKDEDFIRDFLQRRAYNVEEALDFLEDYFDKHPDLLPSTQPKSQPTPERKEEPFNKPAIEVTPIVKQPDSKETSPATIDNTKRIFIPGQMPETIKSYGDCREEYRMLRKDNKLKEYINWKFSIGYAPFSQVCQMEVFKTLDPQVVYRFVHGVQTGKIRLYKPRLMIRKDKLIALRMEETQFDKIKPNPSQKIRELIDNIPYSQDKKGVS